MAALMAITEENKASRPKSSGVNRRDRTGVDSTPTDCAIRVPADNTAAPRAKELAFTFCKYVLKKKCKELEFPSD